MPFKLLSQIETFPSKKCHLWSAMLLDTRNKSSLFAYTHAMGADELTFIADLHTCMLLDARHNSSLFAYTHATGADELNFVANLHTIVLDGNLPLANNSTFQAHLRSL